MMKWASSFKSIEIHLARMVLRINPLLLPVLVLGAAAGLGLQLLLSFALVTLHEISHCKVALWLNQQVEEIELFPFGGVVKLPNLAGIPPVSEILIALAGPFSNFALLLLGRLLAQLFSWDDPLLQAFYQTNLLIGGLNLLPILPLDGGRVLRAFFSFFIGLRQATFLSIIIGKLLTLFLFLTAFFYTLSDWQYSYFLLLCAFLYGCLRKERKQASFLFVKEVLYKKEALIRRGMMRSRYLTVMETYPLNQLLLAFQSGKYHFVSVLDHRGRVLGTLTETEIMEALGKNQEAITIGSLLKGNR